MDMKFPILPGALTLAFGLAASGCEAFAASFESPRFEMPHIDMPRFDPRLTSPTVLIGPVPCEVNPLSCMPPNPPIVVAPIQQPICTDDAQLGRRNCYNGN